MVATSVANSDAASLMTPRERHADRAKTGERFGDGRFQAKPVAMIVAGGIEPNAFAQHRAYGVRLSRLEGLAGVAAAPSARLVGWIKPAAAICGPICRRSPSCRRASSA